MNTTASAPTTQSAHICLVSEQLLPNLIPVLMDRPRRVHLVVSDGMSMQARRLQGILKRHGIEGMVHPGAPTSSIDRVVEFAEQLAYSLADTAALVLNVTGGNKLMALGFLQTFRDLLPETEVIYTDTAQQRIESLGKQGRPTRPMRSVLQLQDYLDAQGLQRRRSACSDRAWQARATARKPLGKWLARNAEKLEGFIGSVNYAAEQALQFDGSFRAEQALDARSRIAREARERMADPALGLLRVLSSDAVAFVSAESAQWLGGGWLEEHAYWTLHDQGAETAQCSVHLEWRESGNKSAPPINELDALALHRNRLLVIECKTARAGNNRIKDQEILHRLESLGRSAGGTYGSAMLLSARTVPDAMRARAAANSIACFDGAALREFPESVRQWLRA